MCLLFGGARECSLRCWGESPYDSSIRRRMKMKKTAYVRCSLCFKVRRLLIYWQACWYTITPSLVPCYGIVKYCSCDAAVLMVCRHGDLIYHLSTEKALPRTLWWSAIQTDVPQEVKSSLSCALVHSWCKRVPFASSAARGYLCSGVSSVHGCEWQVLNASNGPDTQLTGLGCF